MRFAARVGQGNTAKLPATSPRTRMATRNGHPDTTQRTLLSAGPQQPAPRSACVVVIHGEGLGRRADIGDEPVLVGRSQEADLHITHKSVSREHCRIWRDGDDVPDPRPGRHQRHPRQRAR